RSSAEGARIGDMVRPCIGAGRDSSACRLVGRSHSPCRSIKVTLFALSSVKAGAVMPENVRRSCARRQDTRACLTQFYGLVAVLWIQGKFASCVNRRLTRPQRGDRRRRPRASIPDVRGNYFASAQNVVAVLRQPAFSATDCHHRSSAARRHGRRTLIPAEYLIHPSNLCSGTAISTGRSASTAC